MKFSRLLNPAHLASNTVASGALTGRYTLVVAASADGETAPLGDGYASLRVGAGGTVTLLGSLADGSKLVKTVTIFGGADLPVYVPLNRGKGAVFGWLKLTPGSSEDLSGQVHWISPPSTRRKRYATGFHLVSPGHGSVYNWQADEVEHERGSAADLDDDKLRQQPIARLVLTGGNLPGAVTNEVRFGEQGQVVGSAPDAVRLIFSRRTGLFTGTLDTWAAPRRIRFQGAILQRQSFATGYFSGTNEVGHIYLGP